MALEFSISAHQRLLSFDLEHEVPYSGELYMLTDVELAARLNFALAAGSHEAIRNTADKILRSRFDNQILVAEADYALNQLPLEE